MEFPQDNIEQLPIQSIELPFESDIQLDMLRLDLVDEYSNGNKWFKIKYHVQHLLKENKNGLITFGGAFSNHIAATAYVAHIYGIKAVGIIRGEETFPLNPTLATAKGFGMHLEYMNRSTYRQKHTEGVLSELLLKYPGYYLIPEGGTDVIGVLGAREIGQYIPEEYNIITVAVGTGGTIAGLINGIINQQIIGYSSLKGAHGLTDSIKPYITGHHHNWIINHDYHFGGYGKVKEELISFMREFRERTSIKLDPIYTSKMMFGLEDQIKKRQFPSNSKILAIHTGGLQGIAGMEIMLNQSIY